MLPSRVGTLAHQNRTHNTLFTNSMQLEQGRLMLINRCGPQYQGYNRTPA
jgi:hypothetical protein